MAVKCTPHECSSGKRIAEGGDHSRKGATRSIYGATTEQRGRPTAVQEGFCDHLSPQEQACDRPGFREQSLRSPRLPRAETAIAQLPGVQTAIAQASRSPDCDRPGPQGANGDRPGFPMKPCDRPAVQEGLLRSPKSPGADVMRP